MNSETNITTYHSGTIIHRLSNNKVHNAHGPAIVWRGTAADDAKGADVDWYINGNICINAERWARKALAWLGNKNPTPEQVQQKLQQGWASIILE